MNNSIIFSPEIKYLMNSKPRRFIRWGISLFLVPFAIILFFIFSAPVTQFKKSNLKLYPIELTDNAIEQITLIRCDYSKEYNIQPGMSIFLQLGDNPDNDVIRGVVKSIFAMLKNNVNELNVEVKDNQIDKYFKNIIQSKKDGLTVLSVDTTSLAKIIGKRISPGH